MDLATLRPELSMHAPADYPVLDFYLLRGAIDFFTRSEAWQETGEVNIAAGADSFDVPAVSDGEFIKLVALEIGERLLTGADLRKFCASGESGTVWLAQQAEGDITIKVTAVYAPADDATTINDAIGRQYRDGLLSAAMSKLYLIPKMPWTDGTLSEVHRIKWETLADKARRSAYEGKQITARRTLLNLIGGI